MPESLTLGYMTSQYARVGDTYVRREVAHLRRLGHVVHTFSIRKADPSELIDEEIRREQAGTEYLFEAGPLRLVLAGLRAAIARPRAMLAAARLAIRSVPPGIPRRWIRRVVYLLEAAYLAEHLEAKGIGHLHNHIGENSALVAMLASGLSGVPYSLTIHGPGEFDRPTLLALDEKVRRAAFVVTISEFTRSQLYRWTDSRDWPKIRVIHGVVGPAHLEHGPAPIPSAPRLVSLGRLVEQKGQAILIEAAARLREWGHDFELVLMGGGPLRGALERQVERLGLRGRVHLTGHLSDEAVFREILAARALVLPSFAEGLPGVFGEAMALGRPVVSTYIAGHPELIEPGVNGWLVPAGAVEPLAVALAEVLRADPADLEQMGRAGAARVAEQHHPGPAIGRLAALFADPAASVDRPHRRAPTPQAAALRAIPSLEVDGGLYDPSGRAGGIPEPR
jgi:glycosyltransferase involved in cell wall biosynthesis